MIPSTCSGVRTSWSSSHASAAPASGSATASIPASVAPVRRIPYRSAQSYVSYQTARRGSAIIGATVSRQTA